MIAPVYADKQAFLIAALSKFAEKWDVTEGEAAERVKLLAEKPVAAEYNDDSVGVYRTSLLVSVRGEHGYLASTYMAVVDKQTGEWGPMADHRPTQELFGLVDDAVPENVANESMVVDWALGNITGCIGAQVDVSKSRLVGDFIWARVTATIATDASTSTEKEYQITRQGTAAPVAREVV